ncbi:hypothetical protein [Chitiniphilus eburneus]|uniref:Uncharacterized protein n=1 Tax=Chitiniphilus eburneus TaxID=2571148 RepID=A0A4U0PYU9_9NEIS|nr:hypothetical protein [Chitiniphilus eburneus]TJZ73775.1 hypothetical protein FAZ21_09130 [Chitiniphilus eburneus]
MHLLDWLAARFGYIRLTPPTPVYRPVYARGGRDICVKVYLNPEEYISLCHIVDALGYVSHSDFFRRGLNQFNRSHAAELSSGATCAGNGQFGPKTGRAQ